MTLFIYIQAHIFTIIYINIKMYIEKQHLIKIIKKNLSVVLKCLTRNRITYFMHIVLQKRRDMLLLFV